MILEFKTVTKSYIEGNTTQEALTNINLKIMDNTSNIIIGPSGSGKSTLIRLASLLTAPTKGEIIINDINTAKLSLNEQARLRREEIGIIYQRDNLFPFLNLIENVQTPQLTKDKKLAARLLKKTGLKEINKCPREISHIDQQKVALARALINNPAILLADEPTGELNSGNTREYINLIMEIAHKCAVLMVSNNHNLSEHFDNVFFLDDGILH